MSKEGVGRGVRRGRGSREASREREARSRERSRMGWGKGGGFEGRSNERRVRVAGEVEEAGRRLVLERVEEVRGGTNSREVAR